MGASDLDELTEGRARASVDDLDLIWSWNHQLPPTHNFCMHDKVSEQAQKLRDKVAVCSWDGNLTYTQIDQYSTSIGHSLKDAGVQLHDVLPICFEKSMWTVVAMLAVMKVGATFVLMDPTLPLVRLQNTATQVGAKTMLTSRMQHDLSASISPEAKLLVVEANTFTHAIHEHRPQLTSVTPTTLMYIIFTSGSTGTPKGVMISHRTYSSSALPRAKAVGYTEKSRVLDFASYAFDVSIDSMLLTLSNGGCLCIPSDHDRLNDMNGVIRKMQVNYAGLTPSVARILDPDVIASLDMLGLGGEAVMAREANRWGQVTRIVIGYGPCECTIGCTINASAATGRDYISIGRGNGAAIWIVDPDDHQVLSPVGAVGELLVEGPIVGQGYLHDVAKTEAGFINNPTWLTAGHKSFVGRRGRVYKSGDLVKYDPEGSGDIVFVGRKDTQVKVRGQRVELGEIEWQLQALLSRDVNVVAEVVVPDKSQSQPMLMAFVASVSDKAPANTDQELRLVQPADEITKRLSTADADLASVLPRYMIPTAYVPINYIPVLISGKTDRKRLRKFGATVKLQQLHPHGTRVHSQGLSHLEHRTRQAWSRTLKLPEETILLGSNFFALGADSVAAMKLVSVCKELGLDLTVVNIFRHPTLSAMAGVVHIREPQARLEVPAFSMISQDTADAQSEAARACRVETATIEDIFPCTPGQESLYTFSLKSATPYVAQRVARLPKHMGLERWKGAWEEAVAACPILRSRLIQSQNSGLRQVVLREQIAWGFATDLAQYLEEDRNERMDLGQSLARYAIVECSSHGETYMVWTIHHAVYDGWSEPLMLRKVVDALHDRQVKTTKQMKDFVKHLRDADQAAMRNFWQRELDGVVGSQFPTLPHRDYMPTADARLERRSLVKMTTGSPFTMATYLRGALALVISQYTGSDDIVLSETLTGRDVPLAEIEDIEGPLITTIPVRILINRANTVESYLQMVQQDMAARAPYEHYGIQNVRRVSQDAQYACEARVGLVIQPAPSYTGEDLGFEESDVVGEALKFNPYPIMLACENVEDGLRICASFDSGLISVAQTERLLGQIEVAYSQLLKGLQQNVGDMSCVAENELDQIWQWNSTPPLPFQESAGGFRAGKRVKIGSAYPPAWVSWVCHPRNSSLLSPIGCVGELWIEGNFAASETNATPCWLSNGSSRHGGRAGKVQATGDLVRLQEDGSLQFVGRKSDVLSVHGHHMNIADLEAQFTKHLPSTIRAAAAVSDRSSDPTQQISPQELVTFIEQQPGSVDRVHLLSADHTIKLGSGNDQDVEMTICAKISTDLVDLVGKLDKAIRDSLPPYMIPTVYIVVDEIPQNADHKSLSQFASRIPQRIVDQVRESLKKSWIANSMQAKLTPTESVLRMAWSETLNLAPEQIALDDNFFRLGADSVLAMRLISSLRSQGHTLTMADIFRHMRLRDAATVLKLNQISRQESLPYQAFSTLGGIDIEPFLSEIVQPQLAEPSWSVQDVLPVTDSQALDVRATVQIPRTSVQYTMVRFDQGIDRAALHHACHELVRLHSILRTVFIEHQTRLFQVVLDNMSVQVDFHQTQADIDGYVHDQCMQDAEFELRLGSSFLKLTHVEGKDGASCLIIRLSHAQYDGTSLPNLLRDLEILYTGGELVGVEHFSSYMARTCDTTMQAKAVTYWRDLLCDSSFTVPNGPSVQPGDRSVFLEAVVDVSQKPVEITIANVVAAAWALVLCRRLHVSDVTFGGVTSGRQIDMANVDKVMGPCYQFTPIRIKLESQWTAIDLLQSVQRQRSESAAHDFLGFADISSHCTAWPSKARFYDSIVHHQDFEDFDTMSFAGKDCRVDTLNPHGDAVHPLKIASFIRNGRLHVGVVGCAGDSGFARMILSEVTEAARYLTRSSVGHEILRF